MSVAGRHFHDLDHPHYYRGVDISCNSHRFYICVSWSGRSARYTGIAQDYVYARTYLRAADLLSFVIANGGNILSIHWKLVTMNKSRTIIFGVLLGAVTGLIAAVLLNRRAERNESVSAITSGEGLKLGVLVLGLLRAIASLNDD